MFDLFIIKVENINSQKMKQESETQRKGKVYATSIIMTVLDQHAYAI